MMETETPARPGSIAAFADDLDLNGFVRIPGLLDPQFMDTLLLRAHARLFRESAEARAKVKSTGSLCHLSDSPEFADIIGHKGLIDTLRGLGASDPRWTGGFLISKPAGGPPLFWHQDWWGWTEPERYKARPQQWFAMIKLTDTKIGRASCRESVGQEVVITVGGVALNKQKTKK